MDHRAILAVIGAGGLDLGDPELHEDEAGGLAGVDSGAGHVGGRLVLGAEVVGEEVGVVEEADDAEPGAGDAVGVLEVEGERLLRRTARRRRRRQRPVAMGPDPRERHVPRVPADGELVQPELAQVGA